MGDPRPLSVAVLVDLERTRDAGGHVKCWERLAEAAADHPHLDLTLYVLGRRRDTETVARNVRIVALPPTLSTRPALRIVGGVDVSDLAPYNFALARHLPAHDVWHLTHTMSFAATALRLSRRVRRPMVASVHTDVPLLTRMYVEQVLRGLPSGLLRDGARALKLPTAAAAVARRQRNRILAACDRVLVSNSQDHADICEVVPRDCIAFMRRGVDTDLFHPGVGNRPWLARRLGVAARTPVVLFAGRVDATKGALLLAEAVQRVIGAGQPAHLALAGTGADSAGIAAMLGRHATLFGRLSQPELARLYASSDVLAFPSGSETAGNVVAEAMACGLPAVLPRGARTAQWLSAPGEDGVLVGRDGAAAWAAALTPLLGDPSRLASLARRAATTAVTEFPTWRDVLDQDLLPVWRSAGAGAGAATTGGPPGGAGRTEYLSRLRES